MAKKIDNIAGMKKYIETLYLLNPDNNTKLLSNEKICCNWGKEKKICCTHIKVKNTPLYYERAK